MDVRFWRAVVLCNGVITSMGPIPDDDKAAEEAKKKNHLLFFDDFLGLYHAGITSQSDLSVAHVLKPYVERRDVRLIAEMTPETFRVLPTVGSPANRFPR